MERLRLNEKTELWYPDGNAVMDSYGEDLLDNDKYHHVKILDYVGLKGACLIDVGAYVGVFTHWAISKGISRAICFEPIYETYKCLIANRNERPSWMDVQAYPYALTPSTGFFFMEGEGQKATVIPLSNDNSQRVLGVSFDDFYPCLNLDPEDHLVIKMDIEGQEMKALLGAISFLREYKKLTFILCTYHYPEQYEDVTETLQKFMPSFSHISAGEINGNNALMIASNWRSFN